MTLNRISEPEIILPEKIEITKAKKFTLDNGINCFEVSSPNQDILKIEFVFEAGNLFEPARLVASATNELVDDGTKKLTSNDIAAKFDYYGASIQLDCSFDHASVTLFTLGKYLKETLPVFHEIINEPVFPDEELNTYQVQYKQRLSVNNNKVEFLARKTFAETIFGKNHPYGYWVNNTDIDTLNRDLLLQFHQQAYHNKNQFIIISGNVTREVKQQLNKIFGNDLQQNNKENENLHATIAVKNSSAVYSEKKDALQSAIRVGRKLFNKTHPDFTGMSILNTILGGYFGSRLMSNIREDKGYTYGIGSGLISLKEAGYFFIATEVGANVTKETLTEIYREISRLQEEPVGQEELKTVKNYLAGAFMRSIDGPFALADKWKAIHLFGLNYDYYERYLDVLRSITPETLQMIATKYLKISDLTEVVVGKK